MQVDESVILLDALKRAETRSVAPGIRWIKYEEKVDSGDHWSKPHVSTLPLHAITTLRSSIADGSCLVCMDLPVDDDITTKQVAGTENCLLFCFSSNPRTAGGGVR